MVAFPNGSKTAHAVVVVLVACAVGSISCHTGDVSPPTPDGARWGCDACAPIAEYQNNPSSLAASEDAIYWINRGASTTKDGVNTESTGGSVMKASFDGGIPVVLDGGLVSPVSLVIDGASVYWASHGTSAKAFRDGSIAKVDKDGSRSAIVVSGLEGAGLIAVNDTSFFWVATVDPTETTLGGPTLFRSAKDGSGATRLASVPSVTALAADESGVYVIDQTALKRVGNETDEVEVLADDLRFEGGTHLVLDGVRAYWMSVEEVGHERSTGIFSVGKNGVGQPKLSSNVSGLRGLTTDGSFVYWTQRDDDDWRVDAPKTIWKAPVNGGIPIQIASLSDPSSQSWAGWTEGLAVGSSHVYATTLGMESDDAEQMGEVIAIAK